MLVDQQVNDGCCLRMVTSTHTTLSPREHLWRCTPKRGSKLRRAAVLGALRIRPGELPTTANWYSNWCTKGSDLSGKLCQSACVKTNNNRVPLKSSSDSGISLIYRKGDHVDLLIHGYGMFVFYCLTCSISDYLLGQQRSTECGYVSSRVRAVLLLMILPRGSKPFDRLMVTNLNGGF